MELKKDKIVEIGNVVADRKFGGLFVVNVVPQGKMLKVTYHTGDVVEISPESDVKFLPTDVAHYHIGEHLRHNLGKNVHWVKFSKMFGIAVLGNNSGPFGDDVVVELTTINNLSDKLSDMLSEISDSTYFMRHLQRTLFRDF